MQLSAEKRAALEAELAQLTEARTSQLTGTQVSKVQNAGRSVEYGQPTAGSAMTRDARIREIEMLLGHVSANRSRQIQL
ncbi:gpW family head-tail joining protein [Pyruvatibacter sp.]